MPTFVSIAKLIISGGLNKLSLKIFGKYSNEKLFVLYLRSSDIILIF